MSSGTTTWLRRDSRLLLPGAIAAAILLQLELVFSKSINWDEFHHFSQIHQFLQGQPVQWLQVPHIWLFSWVPTLPGDNILHIQLIRALILPFEVLTIWAVVAASRHLASRDAAMLCGLLYVTGGYVFLHGFALRADAIAAGLLTTALWILLSRDWKARELVAIVILVAIAFVSTVKSVLYAPAFLGVAMYRIQNPSRRWKLLGAVGLAGAAALLFVWSSPRLAPDGPFGALRDVGTLGRSSLGRMFSAGLLPQSQWIEGQILRAPVLCAALAGTLISLAFSNALPARERLLQASLLLPLLTVVVYRNAFPYHFVFILPPAMIAMAPALRAPLDRLQPWPICLTLLASAAALSLLEDRKVLHRQRTIQSGVQQIFPEPVRYIDSHGMVGNFPRAVGEFASGWALVNYHKRGLPAYSLAMQAEPTPLLIANNSVLLAAMFDLDVQERLLREDEFALQDTYLQHWGRVFVAGKRLPPGDSDLTIQIRVAGQYTIGGGSLVIDGQRHDDGSVVSLSRGLHRVEGGRTGRITIKWGDHLRVPEFDWPDEPLFTAY